MPQVYRYSGDDKNSVKPCPSLIVLDYNAKKSTNMAYKGYYKLASDLGSSKKT